MRYLTTILVCLLLVSGLTLAGDQPEKGTSEIALGYGAQSQNSDLDSRDDMVGVLFRNWRSESWSLGGQVTGLATDGNDTLSGDFIIAFHKSALYVPFGASYLNNLGLPDSFALTGGVGLGFMPGSHLRLEFEATASYPESADLRDVLDGNDLIYRGMVRVGFPF